MSTIFCLFREKEKKNHIEKREFRAIKKGLLIARK